VADKIKLILTDLDGTLLHSGSHQVSTETLAAGEFNRPYFRRIKQLLAERGIAFAVVTGKQTERVGEVLGADSQDVWILGDSASRITYNGEVKYQSLIDNALGLQVIATLEAIQPDETIIACTPTAAYILETRPEFERIGVRRSYAVVKEISDFKQIKEDFVKITVLDVKGRAFETIKGLSQYQDRLYLVPSEPMWIDITDYDVHKGTTVRRLQQLLGVTKAETIAFGDGYNDLEMFAEAGTTYAMANAFPEVKAAATHIAPSNDDDGVLKTIEKLLQ